MKSKAWLNRLGQQLPGWVVWTSSTTPRWRAVPAPAGTTLTQARDLPGWIRADTPQQLRALAQDRYGWDDYCETCGTPARECGHRQPERDSARRAS